MLAQKVTRQPPATSCLVLAQQDGADVVAGFFGSSYRKTVHKVELTAFRCKRLEDVFDPVPLETIDTLLSGDVITSVSVFN